MAVQEESEEGSDGGYEAPMQASAMDDPQDPRPNKKQGKQENVQLSRVDPKP